MAMTIYVSYGSISGAVCADRAGQCTEKGGVMERGNIIAFHNADSVRKPDFPSPETVSRALENREFRPWFQPVVHAGSGALCGCEVLVRWERPDAGVISPETFVPWMERTGLIVPVTTQLMQQVAGILGPVGNRLPAHFHVGINLCAGNLLSPALERACAAFHARADMHNVTLVMELTERVPFPASPDVEAKLFRLARKNIAFALDDFGTGWSTYHYLRRVPVDIIKIDKQFVGDFLTDEVAECIIDSMVYLADRLKLDVIAEGVETRAQADSLFSKGVNFLQGYLFSPPLNGEDFIKKWVMSPPMTVS